ncbi:efflux RND transporter permease subunit [Aureibacter tunicatorum]|uniref:Multidrug efflux pump subunit AcrB n=1 Tax=Aureibacter tunicatorum TaxID=866807 RepID=A0AAE3XNG4_9BACT|nr:efflux RND transporter permease subunit [Aureibacter tunicatorum]MDR6238294.1 multidrug efflux pump subunit AcrB [Aureibacter tunicatorum]BDD03327.1 copper transporter [Aureibacter tunicatorum]
MEEKDKNKLLKEFGLTTMSVNNRATVFVITVLIITFGVFSYQSLPRENFPEVKIPTVYIGTAYPGNSPIDMEDLVTRPIEREVKLEKDIDKITSTSVDGYSAVSVEFATNVDVSDALSRVKNAVDKAKIDLPKDLPADPDVQELDFAEFPILNISFSGDYSKAQLRDFADMLKDQVERFPEVSKGEIKGVDDREVHINVDPYEMEAREISFGDIEQAVQAENINVSGGEIVNDGIRRSVRIEGEFENPQGMLDIIVKEEGSKPVYLGDIATVDYGYVDQESFSKVNLHPVVTLDVIKRSGENLLDATEKVYGLLDQMQETKVFPSDLEIIVTGDQSTKTRKDVKNLENNIISGVILVVLVLLFFLNTRNALFVGMAIPLSMFMSFMILGAFGITINMMVLFSLIMALGMLVDNGIVVVENVYRLMEEGMNPIEAAKKGVGEVAWPIIASTATTLAAFLPLALWPGIMGQFMRYLPITLMITLSSSLFVALVINPVFIATFMKVEKEKKVINHKRVLTIGGSLILVGILFLVFKKTVVGNLFGVAGTLVLLDVYVLTPLAHKFQNTLLPWLERVYEKVLTSALNGKMPYIYFGGTVMALFVSFGLLVNFMPNVLFFPENIPTQVHVFVEYPVGTDIQKTITLAEELEVSVNKVLEPYRHAVKSVVTSVGIGSNDPGAEITAEGAATPHKARITVDFVDFEEREGVDTREILNEIRGVTGGYVGVSVTADKNSDGPPVGKPVQIEVSGEDYQQIIEISENLISRVNNSGIEGIEKLKSDLEVGKPQYSLKLDREQARIFGISTGQIAEELRTSIFGKDISTYKDGIDDWDIKVRLAEPYRYDPTTLLNRRVTFQNKQGKIVQVPISSVANFDLTSTYGAIKHKDQKRVVTITSNVLDGYNATLINDQIRNLVDGMELPIGYNIVFGGEQEKQAEEMAFLSQALLLAIFLIFIILVAQFNAISAPFIVLSSVVFSTIGVFMGLVIFQMDFIVIMTMLGIISLAGIVVNNAIVLIDYTNLLKARAEEELPKGKTLTIEMIKEQIVNSGKTRLRPVLLTAITTVLGLLPLAIGLNIDFIKFLQEYNFDFFVGGDNVAFWGPMSWTIIFGLTFATFLTLVIVPVMYLLIEKLQKALRRS